MRYRWGWIGRCLGLAGVLLCCGCSRAEAYAPTGDALYDRYAQLVLGKMREANWNAAPPCWLSGDDLGMMHWLPGTHPDETQQPVLIDGADVLHWESDFASDPRYWELRYTCVAAGSDEESRTRHKADLDKLNALCGAGRGDEGAFELLYSHAAQRIDPEQDTLEEAQLAVCDHALKQFPDNSYWYYRKALAEIDLGEPELALAALKQGNASKRNAWPRPFPLSTLFEQRFLTATQTDNRIVSGALSIVDSDDLPNFIRIKEAFKNEDVMLALGGDPGLADELLKMAGRMARMEGATPVFQTAMSAMPRVVANYAGDELLSGSAASDPDLLWLKSSYDEFVKLAGKLAPDFPPYIRDSKPGRTAYQRAVLKGDEAMKTADPDHFFSGAYKNMPALVKADWLAFDQDFRDGQQAAAKHESFFTPLDNPPIARLFAAADGQYKAELQELRAKSRAMRLQRHPR